MTPFQHYASSILLLLLTSSAYHPVGLIHNHLWNPSIMTLVSDCHVLPDGSISSRNKSTELFNCPCPCIVVVSSWNGKNHQFNTIFYSSHSEIWKITWRVFHRNENCLKMVNVKKQVYTNSLYSFHFWRMFLKKVRSMTALSITSAYSFKNIFFAIIYQGSFSDKNNN